MNSLAHHITPDFVIDVGANVGGWYKECKAIWPDAEYVLIEGNPECEEMLKLLDVDFRIALLSDREKEVEFFTLRDCATATGASYYREQTTFFEGDKARSTIVKTTTLDQVLAETEVLAETDLVETVLLKIDTQGSELDILRGGKWWTVPKAAAILLEVPMPGHVYNIGAPSLDEVSSYMAEIGFFVCEIIGDIRHPITQEIVQRDILYKRL